MAYALNRNPRHNLRGQPPAPVIGRGSLSLGHYASSPGIIYFVVASTDLEHWQTDGVTWNDLHPNDPLWVASVEIDCPQRYFLLMALEE